MCRGRLGVVVRRWEEDGIPLAMVDTGTGLERACLLAEAGAGPGDHVLLHMGFVVEVLDPESAASAVGPGTDAPRMERGERT
jgi:hydrogenase maturation factor